MTNNSETFNEKLDNYFRFDYTMEFNKLNKISFPISSNDNYYYMTLYPTPIFELPCLEKNIFFTHDIKGELHDFNTFLLSRGVGGSLFLINTNKYITELYKHETLLSGITKNFLKLESTQNNYRLRTFYYFEYDLAIEIMSFKNIILNFRLSDLSIPWNNFIIPKKSPYNTERQIKNEELEEIFSSIGTKYKRRYNDEYVHETINYILEAYFYNSNNKIQNPIELYDLLNTMYRVILENDTNR